MSIVYRSGCVVCCHCARVSRRLSNLVPAHRWLHYARAMGMSIRGSREINVTPLIDVLLVLLIIFLVMMPIMVRMETVALPPESKDASTEITHVLKLEADLSVSIDDGPQF